MIAMQVEGAETPAPAMTMCAEAGRKRASADERPRVSRVPSTTLPARREVDMSARALPIRWGGSLAPLAQHVKVSCFRRAVRQRPQTPQKIPTAHRLEFKLGAISAPRCGQPYDAQRARRRSSYLFYRGHATCADGLSVPRPFRAPG